MTLVSMILKIRTVRQKNSPLNGRVIDRK